MAKIGKGVVVEFDFAVLNGADILFETASGILKGHGIVLDSRLEALHLAGGNYQGALAELFAKVECDAEPATVARGCGHARVQELHRRSSGEGCEGRGCHARRCRRPRSGDWR